MLQTFVILLVALTASLCQANLLRFVRCTCPPATCTCVPTNASTQVLCSCVPPEECECSAQEQQQDCIPVCQDVCRAQCTGETCGPLCQSICTDSCISATMLIQQNPTITNMIPPEGDPPTTTLLPPSDSEQGMSTSAIDSNGIQNAQQSLPLYPPVGDHAMIDTDSENTSSVIPLQRDEPQTPPLDPTTPSEPADPTDGLDQESTSATQQPTEEPQASEQTVEETISNETNPIQPASYPGCTICFQLPQQPYQQTYQPLPYVQPYYVASQPYAKPQPQPQYYSPQQACPTCMPTVTITFCNLCATGICCK